MFLHILLNATQYNITFFSTCHETRMRESNVSPGITEIKRANLSNSYLRGKGSLEKRINHKT